MEIRWTNSFLYHFQPPIILIIFYSISAFAFYLKPSESHCPAYAVRTQKENVWRILMQLFHTCQALISIITAVHTTHVLYSKSSEVNSLCEKKKWKYDFFFTSSKTKYGMRWPVWRHWCLVKKHKNQWYLLLPKTSKSTLFDLCLVDCFMKLFIIFVSWQTYKRAVGRFFKFLFLCSIWIWNDVRGSK